MESQPKNSHDIEPIYFEALGWPRRGILLHTIYYSERHQGSPVRFLCPRQSRTHDLLDVEDLIPGDRYLVKVNQPREERALKTVQASLGEGFSQPTHTGVAARPARN